MNAMPKELQLRVRERKSKTSEDAATLADDIISARDSIFNANEIGHIASKCSFPAKRGSGRNNAGYYFYDNTRSPSIGASVENTESREREYMCQGLVEGKPAELLVDSGASCTLVHQALVAPEKINTDDQLQIKCAHGDLAVYPTANIEINIDVMLYHVRAGVSPSLPRPVLLGRDIGNLLELAVREQEAYAVLTRIQRRRKEKEEAAALTKEITSGVKPRPLTTESEEENEESVVLNRFDDSIFPRKTKKQKRAAKALYHGRTQTVAPGKHDDDTKKKEEMPDTTESTCSQENKD